MDKTNNPGERISTFDDFRYEPQFDLTKRGKKYKFGKEVPRTHRTIPASEKKPPRRHPFIKGPIDLDWILRVQRLPGKTSLAVALALIYQRGLESSESVRLTKGLLDRFELKPRSVFNALKSLEAANLVRVTHKKGSCRIVEVLDKERLVYLKLLKRMPEGGSSAKSGQIANHHESQKTPTEDHS